MALVRKAKLSKVEYFATRMSDDPVIGDLQRTIVGDYLGNFGTRAPTDKYKVTPMA